jgi:hypothetical protein
VKYHYFYQSHENKTLDDWIVAKNRDDVYAQLRKRGIKPFKVLGRNPYAWKRWTAIAVLAALVAVLFLVLLRGRIKNLREAENAAFASEERSQIYGDNAILHELASDGWRKAMGNEGDAWLARHAIPGVMCDCATGGSQSSATASDAKKRNLPALTTSPVRIAQDDVAEVAKMKRLVNNMKQELAEYLAADGTPEDYMALCDERLRTERDILSNVTQELKTLETRMTPENYDETAALWAKKNAMLRSLGLPTLVIPDDPKDPGR